MSFRPALVDPQGWSHNWQRGWSHVTGKTSDLLVPCDWQTTLFEQIKVPSETYSGGSKVDRRSQRFGLISEISLGITTGA